MGETASTCISHKTWLATAAVVKVRDSVDVVRGFIKPEIDGILLAVRLQDL